MSLIPEEEFDAESGSFLVSIASIAHLETAEQDCVENFLDNLNTEHPTKTFSAFKASQSDDVTVYWHDS